MTKQELLKKAQEHCFFIGINDSGSELCKANMAYGIAGIQHIQKQLGMEPNATFISTPDMTITRNEQRWKSGFGYGGKITWGSKKDELIILNTKPNACGMIVGGLNKAPNIETLIRKLHEIEHTKMQINGIDIQWDFYKSNHFIDIFRVKPIAKLDFELPPYIFIMHGSAGELSADNDFGFGLYYDRSEKLQKMSEIIDTPFNKYQVLTGDNAKQYYDRYKFVENFAKQKRRLAAEMLFGEFTEISNETHQGLINMNEIVLGCHYVEDYNTLFPFTLRGDLPAYLVKGQPSLTPEVIEALGFEKRAQNQGVYDRLLNANIIPHGGGYVLPDILTVNKVIEIDNNRYFEMEMQNDRGKQIISEVQELPFEYRGRKVVLRALETGLIDINVKLIPEFIFKI